MIFRASWWTLRATADRSARRGGGGGGGSESPPRSYRDAAPWYRLVADGRRVPTRIELLITGDGSMIASRELVGELEIEEVEASSRYRWPRHKRRGIVSFLSRSSFHSELICREELLGKICESKTQIYSRGTEPDLFSLSLLSRNCDVVTLRRDKRTVPLSRPGSRATREEISISFHDARPP